MSERTWGFNSPLAHPGVRTLGTRRDTPTGALLAYTKHEGVGLEFVRFVLRRLRAQRALGVGIVVTLPFAIAAISSAPIFVDGARSAIYQGHPAELRASLTTD